MVFKKIFALKNLTDTTHILDHPNSSTLTLYNGSNLFLSKSVKSAVMPLMQVSSLNSLKSL